jgi:hypothetical protein
MVSFISFVAIIIIWTVVRETLLDKYWRYTKNNHLYEFGNLYVILGCVAATILLSLLL